MGWILSRCKNGCTWLYSQGWVAEGSRKGDSLNSHIQDGTSERELDSSWRTPVEDRYKK